MQWDLEEVVIRSSYMVKLIKYAYDDINNII